MVRHCNSEEPVLICYMQMTDHIHPADSAFFYKNLKSFAGSENLMNAANYSALPDDWSIVITDIRGSTKAIEEGRYKDVNVVGVTSIISTQNACGDAVIPYIFGGDGATLFIPNSKVPQVKKALAYSRFKAQSEFNLNLRIAIIPMNVVKEKNKSIQIAKMYLSGDTSIAMAKGDGLALAEDLTKKTEDYLVDIASEHQGSHQGLECRWNPVSSQRGHMLALIIKVKGDTVAALQQYQEIIKKINQIVPELAPITSAKLSTAWPPVHLFKEAQSKYTGFKQYTMYLATVLQVLLLTLVVKLKKNDPQSLVAKVITDIATNTDYLKFDDTLRMIIDVDNAQKIQIEQYLQSLEAEKKIKYGLHSSNEALMTCYVQASANHVHFIDGGSGGYAMAAKIMKMKV